MSTTSSFTVRFAVGSEERFAALTHAYDRIRECKAQKKWPKDKAAWTPYFDHEALGHFWWPTDSELEDWKKRYMATPAPRRFTDPSLQHPWDFLSLFDAFENGDYELHAMKRISVGEAALPFDPYGHPYGETGCMRALIEAFDHRVTEDAE